MTKILIVYCHPYAKRFNHAILEAVKHNFDHHQVSYTVIDLYQDQFVPSYDVAELRLLLVKPMIRSSRNICDSYKRQMV